MARTASKSASAKSSKAKPKAAGKLLRAGAGRGGAHMYCYCNVKPSVPREFPPGTPQGRVSAITTLADKWVNGTVLHYYFFDQPSDGTTVTLSDGTTQFVTWKAAEGQKKMVRDAFEKWKSLGIGLDFKETKSREEAEIRIGFMQGDGSWSYVGRAVLTIGPDQRNMNFGWDLSTQPDTALHEIGHSIGFAHEHQNPFSGIVWNEPKVYSTLAGPPNSWSHEKTFWNIIRKLPENSVQGTQWDPNSVMHYPFEAGMILEPEKYRTEPLIPAGGLSARDQTWVKQLYPAQGPADSLAELKLLQSEPLKVQPGQQRDVRLLPTASRYYEMRTFGVSDTVMVLFEDVNGELRYRSGDDDSGEDRNAYIRIRLIKGRKYVLRLRLFYADRAGETAVMWW